MVKNYMETLVEDTLQKELSENSNQYPGLCLCPSCIAAIQASALNHLKPFYVTCIAGEVFGEYHSKELQNLSDVLVAVVNGIQEVLQTSEHCRQLQAVQTV